MTRVVQEILVQNKNIVLSVGSSCVAWLQAFYLEKHAGRRLQSSLRVMVVIVFCATLAFPCNSFAFPRNSFAFALGVWTVEWLVWKRPIMSASGNP